MRIVQWAVRLCIFVVALALCCLAVLPTILSTSKGRNFAEQQLSRLTQAKVSLGNIELGWTKSQKIDSIEVEKPGQYHLHVNRIIATAPLLQFLWPWSDFGAIHIESPVFECELPSQDVLGKHTEGSSSSPGGSAIVLARPLIIEVKDAHLACRTAQGVSGLQHMDLQVQLQGPRSPAKVILKASSLQNEKSGHVDLQVLVEDLSKAFHTLSAAVELQDFPLQIVIPFIPQPYAKVMESWAREPLQLNCQFQRVAQGGKYHLSLKSKPVQAFLDMEEKDGHLTLTSPSSAKVQLTAQESSVLFAAYPFLPTISSDLQMTLNVENLEIDEKNFQNLKVGASLQLEALKLNRGNQTSVLGPFSATLTKADQAHIELRSLGSKNPRCHLEVNFGKTLDWDGLKTAKLALDRWTKEDIAVWVDLPDSKGVFPLAMNLQAENQEGTIAFDTQVRGPSLQGQFQGGLSANRLYLVSAHFDLPEWNFPQLFVAPAQVKIDHLSCSLDSPLDTFDARLQWQVPRLQCQNLSVEQTHLAIESKKGNVDVSAHNALASVNIGLRLKPGRLELTRPAVVQANLTPEQIKLLSGHNWFHRTIQADLKVQPFIYSWHSPAQNKSVQILGKVQNLSLRGPSQKEWVVPDIEVQLASELSLASTVIEARSLKMTHMEEQPQFSIHAAFKNLELEQANLQLNKIPTSWVDVLIQRPSVATTLLGPQLKLQAKLKMLESRPQVQVTADSPNLKANFEVSPMSPSGWRLDKPMQLQWMLSEEGYLALDKALAPNAVSGPFVLKKPLKLDLEASKLEVLDIRQFLSTLTLDCHLRLDDLLILEKNAQRISRLNNVDMRIQHTASEKNTSIKATGHMSYEWGASKDKKTTQEGALAIEARMQDWWHYATSNNQSKLSFSIDQALLDCNLHVDKLPSDLLDFAARFAQVYKPLSKIVGPELSLQASSHTSMLSGPTSVEVSCETLKTKVLAKLNKGKLTLSEPIKAHLTLNRVAAQELLGDIYPLQPISIEVSNNQFSLPIYPFNKEQINLQNAHLELGKFECKNKGNLSLTLGLLKWNQRKGENNLTLWFTPVDISIRHGIANIDRVDLLVADTFPLAIWGKVDLPKDRLDIMLGITREAFVHAFGMVALPPNYMMLLPIQGPVASASIDVPMATAKMAALLAWQGRSVVGTITDLTPAGRLIDGLLEVVVNLPDHGVTIPESRYPLPWKKGK